uniref:Uncharacterized protein n=1 Tax=Oryza barthii TaxID=65489 RepID=A0A0D3HX37_9ORYZ
MAMAPHSLTHLAVGQVRQLPKGIWAISRIFGSFFITALYRSRNPLFILVYMIESELGSYCNIACTQSRRIVWLKVFLIRGLNLLLDLKDSLFRYQVRLDSAWNERTKLMFCTTGIQLRKLSWKNASSTVNNHENRRTLFYPQWIGGGVDTGKHKDNHYNLQKVPEMLRMPLTELCLQMKLLHLGGIKSFLPKVVAFEGHEELSHLGYHLANLPVDILIGKVQLKYNLLAHSSNMT